MQLKHYQKESLEVLADYFKRVVEVGRCAEGFPLPMITDREAEPRSYTEVPGLVGLPYVCLRLPHRRRERPFSPATKPIPIANRELLQADRLAVVLLVGTRPMPFASKRLKP